MVDWFCSEDVFVHEVNYSFAVIISHGRSQCGSTAFSGKLIFAIKSTWLWGSPLNIIILGKVMKKRDLCLLFDIRDLLKEKLVFYRPGRPYRPQKNETVRTMRTMERLVWGWGL
jgi:hypothetical protein